MVTLGTPQKTPEGVAELSARKRGLSQRHRTLLLLIDGQRRLDQVLHLAQQAGVPRAYIDELVALGLVVVPMQTPAEFAATAAMAPPAPASAAALTTLAASVASRTAALSGVDTGTIDIEIGSNFSVNGPGEGPLEESESDAVADAWDEGDAFGRALSTSELAALDSTDQSLAEARDMLLEALRQEAPVAGAVTMLRVRRARDRETLAALLPEVEQKIGTQRHLTDAAQIIRRAQALLAD